MSENENKKKFKLFDSQREGKGVEKDEIIDFSLKGFFRRLKINLSRLVSVNILLVLGNFPFIFPLIGFAGYFNHNSTAPQNLLYPIIKGVYMHDPSPALVPLVNIFCGQGNLSRMTVTSIVLCFMGLLMLFTYGLVMVGITYIIRNIVTGEGVFIWSDFWYAVKKNWKQGLIAGVTDLLFTGIFIYNFLFLISNLNSFLDNLMFYCTVVCIFVFLCMRTYLYLMMVTFDMSLYKMFKNALIFTFLGFGRNFMALAGALTVFFINYALYVLIMPLGIALPFLLSLAVMNFIWIFAAYPKIKQYMIDPYYEEPASKEAENSAETEAE